MTSFAEILQMTRTLVRALRRETPAADSFDSLGARVQRAAQVHGSQLALICEGETLTWAEFNARINKTANMLKASGVKAGDCVALMMENRTEFLISAIGITKLGAVAGLLNVNQRKHILVHSVKLVAAKKIIVGAECASAIGEVLDELPVQAADIIVVDDAETPAGDVFGAKRFHSRTSTATSDNPTECDQVRLADTCFYILTSGTTGLPKAALFSHARFVAAMYGFGSICLDAKPDDRIYVTLPLYHATALTCGLGSATFAGACMVLRRRFSASQFFADIRAHQCTAFVYIGELCRYLLNQPKHASDATQPATKCIGNGLRPDIWDDFRRRFGITKISEFYGASEGNNVFINAFNKERTIGFPVMKSLLVKYDVDRDEIVRDASGRCVFAHNGEPGLLLNEVSATARYDGYTDPKASEAKLVRDVEKQGDLFFNSGDLLKQIDVGFAFGRPHYQFVDRVGDTFRWKGENCSTNEVAEVINGYPQVAISNVYGVRVPATDGRAGMAAIALKEDSEFDWAAFGQYLKTQLPSYARPLFIRLKKDLNTTSTFKLLKSELKNEAFHLDRVDGDPLYYFNAESSAYEPFDEAIYRRVIDGNMRY